MPLFKRNDKIGFFSHIPKTGGKSILDYLVSVGCDIFLDSRLGAEKMIPQIVNSKEIFKNCAPQHAEIRRVKQAVDFNSVDFSFTVIRDPIQRLISHYNSNLISDDFSSWVNDIFDIYEKNNYIADNHIRPQNEFICDDMIIFKFPDFDGAKKLIDDHFGIEANADFPFNGPSEKRQVNIDDQTMNRIQDFYKQDFKFLNI